MIQSEKDLCNIALTRVGQGNFIESLDEGTKPANLCRLHYPQVRDAVLRSHPWNGAIARATLSLDTTTPNHEFGYRFILPTDCLKVIRTSWEANGFASSAVYGFPGLVGYSPGSAPYRIEGKFLLCNEATVSIEYIRRITDVTQLDENLADVIAQRLAAEICMALTNNASASKNLWDIYQTKLVEARVMDAQEGTPREAVDASGWILARM